MAVDVTQLAAALRIGDGTTVPEEPQLSVLTRVLTLARVYIDRYASVGTPDAVIDQAVVQFAGYLYDQPDAPRGGGHSVAFRNSGALAVLEPWKTRGIGPLGDEPAAVTPQTPGVGGPGVDQVARDAAGLARQVADAAATAAAAAQLAANAKARLDEIYAWAHADNADPIPAAKLVNAPVGQGESGFNAAQALALIKPFARHGVTTPPTPADLAPNPIAARVLGLRTAGGQLELSWNEIVTQGFFISQTTRPTPTQIAEGGLASAGGHVLVVPVDGPEEIWVRYFAASPLVKVATFQRPLVHPNADGSDPDPENNQHRLYLSGNQLRYSDEVVTRAGHSREVTFANIPSGGLVISGTLQFTNFGGNFNDPPDAANYNFNVYIWDRGSQVWLLNQNDGQGGHRWLSYSGPSEVVHGDWYSQAAAEPHVTSVGEVFVIGTGSAQRAKVVTVFVPPLSEETGWRWGPVGITADFVDQQITAHNVDATAHPDIRELIAGIMNAGTGLNIGAYSSTATYSRGSSNSIVTHAGGLYIYISSTQRNSNHDPGQFPGYWFKLSEGVAYEVVTTGAHRFAARTIVIDGDTDATYICTTTQTTPRDLNYIRAQASSIGGAFIRLNAPADLTGIPTVRDFDNSTRNILRKKGDIDFYNTHIYVSTIDHTPGISPSDEPGQNDDFAQIDNVTAPPGGYSVTQLTGTFGDFSGDTVGNFFTSTGNTTWDDYDFLEISLYENNAVTGESLWPLIRIPVADISPGLTPANETLRINRVVGNSILIQRQGADVSDQDILVIGHRGGVLLMAGANAIDVRVYGVSL